MPWSGERLADDACASSQPTIGIVIRVRQTFHNSPRLAKGYDIRFFRLLEHLPRERFEEICYRAILRNCAAPSATVEPSLRVYRAGERAEGAGSRESGAAASRAGRSAQAM